MSTLASDAGCQRKAADPAPPADPLKLQGALQLHSGPDEEKAELLRKVSRPREIAHLYNDEAEEWFGKYMKYKGHQETRITCPAAEALSTVQHCWLQPCPRQDHLRLGCSEA